MQHIPLLLVNFNILKKLGCPTVQLFHPVAHGAPHAHRILSAAVPVGRPDVGALQAMA